MDQIYLDIIVRISTYLEDHEILKMLCLNKQLRRYMLKTFDKYFKNTVFTIRDVSSKKALKGFEKTCLFIDFKNITFKDNLGWRWLKHFPFSSMQCVEFLNIGDNYIPPHAFKHMRDLKVINSTKYHLRLMEVKHLKNIKIIYLKKSKWGGCDEFREHFGKDKIIEVVEGKYN